MKILLFTINSYGSQCPPLGLHMISSYIEKNYSANNIDLRIHCFKQFRIMEIMKFIIKERPEVIGVGCYVWNFLNVIEICERIKKSYPDIKIILGGPSIDFQDNKLKNLLTDNIINYAIEGEGEKTFAELTDYIINNLIYRIKDIKGLMFKNDSGEVCINYRNNEDLLNLNTLTNPYLFSENLIMDAEKYNCVYLETSRGCPYSCSYCGGSQIPFRYKDIGLIADEIRKLANLGVKHIVFLDGTLNFNLSRTKELLRRIINLNVKVSFELEIKAEILDDELIYLLKKVGVNCIEVGLQSSNETTLKIINRYYERNKFIKNVRKLADADIDVKIDLIIGLPDETLYDWYNSLDFCYAIGNVKIYGNVLKILPNTILYREAAKYGYYYDSANCNRIISSSSMSLEMVNYAENMCLALNLFWNVPDSEILRPYIKEICKKYYNDKFSDFLIEFTDWIFINKINDSLKSLNANDRKKILWRFINEKINEGVLG